MAAVEDSIEYLTHEQSNVSTAESITAPNTEHACLDNWELDELRMLLKLVKENGSNNSHRLSSKIPTKSIMEINAALRYCNSEAFLLKNSIPESYPNKVKTKAVSNGPLSSWTNLLVEKYKFDELRTNVGECLTIISECNNIPSKEDTSKCDFKQIYLALANSVEGRPLPTLNQETKFILRKCLLETVLASREFLPQQTLNEDLEKMSRLLNSNAFQDTENEDVCLSNIVQSEEKIIMDLASQTNYNPFKLPLSSLRHPVIPVQTPMRMGAVQQTSTVIPSDTV